MRVRGCLQLQEVLLMPVRGYALISKKVVVIRPQFHCWSCMPRTMDQNSTIMVINDITPARL